MEIRLGSAIVAVSIGIERAPLRELTNRSLSQSVVGASADLESEWRTRRRLEQEALQRERRRVELLGWWNGLYGGGR